MTTGGGAAAGHSVLVGRGATARFDGTELTVVRGRTTWTLPLRALSAAELTAGGTVRVDISGPPAGASHGLGAAVVLKAPNSRAAQAFLSPLRQAIARSRPAEDGHALVRRRTEPPRGPGPAAAKALRIAALVLLYVLLLTGIGLVSPLEDDIALVFTLFGGAILVPGAFPLWRVGRRVHSLWLLRSRGIGVVGRVTGRVRIWSKGAHLWEFSTMDFVTVDGRPMRGVPSVVTKWAFSDGTLPGSPVTLVYDPEHPDRASRPPTAGFLARTAVLACVGAVPFLAGAAMVVTALTG